jgi:hypothetical protein
MPIAQGLRKAALSGATIDARRLPRLSQHISPQRQHAAQPDGVIDVIGVGVAGAGVEQDAQAVTIEHQPRQK